MEIFWGIFQKRIAEMSLDERIILLLVLLICLCLVVIAVSLVVQVVRRLDWDKEQSARAQKALRKGLGRVAETDYYEEVRAGHSD
jgi:uncharacterized protein HemY